MLDLALADGGSSLLFSLVLFGTALVLGRRTIRSSFETTVQALASRATSDLTSARMELHGLCRRVDSLERQVTRLSERLDRCEQEMKHLVTTIQEGEGS